MTFYATWVQENRPHTHVAVLSEIVHSRSTALQAIAKAVRNHIVNVQFLEELGFSATAEAAQNVPKSKRTRSGDLGEILGTEYVTQRMSYEVPFNRLRYREDSELPMRGDDILAVRELDGKPHFLKAECKSRKDLAAGTLSQAEKVLANHNAGPNPRTLSFIRRILMDRGEAAKARVWLDALNKPVPLGQVEHLIFTFSGNSPAALLGALKPRSEPPFLHLVGLHVADHQDFIDQVYAKVVLE